MIPNPQHFQGFGSRRPPVRVGFGRADITPPVGTLCALGIDDEALEIFDPVYVRATLLGEGEDALALVSIDVIGLYQPEMADLRSIIAAETGLRPERVVLHTTHTHESPNTERCFTEIAQPLGLTWHSEAFYELLRRQVVRAVQYAQADTYLAHVSYGCWPVAGIASNRRLRPLERDTVLRQSRSTPEYRLYPEGWIDPYVRLVVFTDPASGREHWLLNYACHPTAAGGDEGPYITGDFPGNAMARIESMRPRITCNYFTGCCGNINPGKYTGSSNDPAARAADVVRLGGLLADSVLAARDHNTGPVASGGVRWARRRVKLDVLPRLRDREALARQLEAEAAAYKARRSAGERERGGGQALFWTLYNLFAARSAGADGMLETEISAVSLGDLGLLFLPGECFLEIDAGVRGRFPDKQLLIAELCDSGPGYVVTPEAFASGGYEAEAALVKPTSLQQLIDAGRAALEEVLGGAAEAA